MLMQKTLSDAGRRIGGVRFEMGDDSFSMRSGGWTKNKIRIRPFYGSSGCWFGFFFSNHHPFGAKNGGLFVLIIFFFYFPALPKCFKKQNKYPPQIILYKRVAYSLVWGYTNKNEI